MFHVPNRYRLRAHPTHGSDDGMGNFGAFLIPLGRGTQALVIASEGSPDRDPLNQWDHCSVSIREDDSTRLPRWDEMCAIKDLFWDAADCVVQFHPPRSQYVNDHPHVLHLWRSVTHRQPLPPRWMV